MADCVNAAELRLLLLLLLLLLLPPATYSPANGIT
jgi:hypothetical protein